MKPRPRYNVVIPTRYGLMIVNRNDAFGTEGDRIGVGHDLLEYGEYVQPELDGLANLIGLCAPDPVILDIGANIGVHSLFFAELAGPRGRVYAFEAQRIVFQMLMGNLAINSVENVFAHGVALGREAGTLKLPPVDYSKPWNFGGMSLTGGEEARQPGAGGAGAEHNEDIPVSTLDSLVLGRVDLIKLDVEGMEEDVLRGGERTLAANRPLLQVEWWGKDQGSLPLYLLERLGYRLFQSAQNLICLPEERSEDFNIQGLPEMRVADVKQAYNLT